MPTTAAPAVPANWSTADQIKNHTLATSIMQGFVFDDQQLATMKQFCLDPSQKDTILREKGMWDHSGNRPDLAATAGGKTGLAEYIIARHGTDNAVLYDKEIEMLKGWFEEK